MEFRVLGPLEAVGTKGVIPLTSGRSRAVLATLLLHPGQVVAHSQLVRGVWVEPSHAAASNLRTFVARLRASFVAAGEPATRLVTEAGGYRLNVHPGELDLLRFEALAEEAASAARDKPAEAADRFRMALRLWRGDPLADLEAIGPLLQDEVARLAERRVTVTERWADAALTAGRHDEVADELALLIRTHPLREHLWAQLILALYRGGRQAEALTAYQSVYQMLKQQLGVAPGNALQQLHQSVLAADPALDWSPQPAFDGSSGLSQAAPDSPTGWATAVPLMPRPPLAIPQQLPPDLRGFVGRAGELEWLDYTAFSSDDTGPRVLVISTINGTAGAGKTALAVRWAHRVATQFTDGQLYVNLRGFAPNVPAASPAEAIRNFLDALGVPPDRVPTSLDAQVGLYRSLLADRRMLVILDNARDAEQVRPLLPGAPGCAVVVTSRNRLPGLIATEGARSLALDLLSVTEAEELLAHRLGESRVAAEPSAVAKIIERCARLPLALAIVSARAITYPKLPLAVLAAKLRGPRHHLDAFAGDDPATDVRGVFSWSYDTLSPDAARLFRLLGLHPGPDVATPAVASLFGELGREMGPLLDELAGAHLLSEHLPGRYTFHDLLRGYAAEMADLHDDEEERRAARHRMLDHYLHTAHAATLLLVPHRYRPITLTPLRHGAATVPLADYAQALAWFAAERQVLLNAIGQASSIRFDTHTWQLAWTLTEFFERSVQWHEWAESQQIALQAAQRANDRTALVHVHQELVRACGLLNRTDEAGMHLDRLRELLEASDVEGHAQLHNWAGWIHYLEGNFQGAVEEASRALEFYRVVGDTLKVAHCLNAVGYFLIQDGRDQKALPFCEQALRMQQEIGDRRGQAATLDSLGLAHFHLGRHAEALDAYLRAIELYELGDRYYQADTLVQVGDVHVAAGDPGAAREAWRAALTILEDFEHADANDVREKLHRLDR